MDKTPVATRRADDAPRSKVGLVAIAAAGAIIVAAVIVVAARASKPGPWKRDGAPISVSAWAPYWQFDAAYTSYTANVAVFSDVSMFAYHVTGPQAIEPYNGVDAAAVARFRDAARASGSAITASVIDDLAPGAMAALLSAPATRALHVQTLVRFARDQDFDGLDIDYESFAFNDGRDTWESTRPNWVAFIVELADALHREHKTLTVSAPYVLDGGHTPDSGYWVYDYAAIGKVVDRVRIMAYDYSTSEPGPIAPLEWVTSVVAAAKDLVPASKLVLGIPVYGRDWAGAVVGSCPPDQQPKSHTVSNTTAEQVAAAKGVAPMWAEHSAERTFSYTDVLSGVDAGGTAVSCTVTRTVWYQDAQAVYERAWVAERQDLSGIALFPLGTDVTAMWPAIDLARSNTAAWPVAPGASSLPAT